MGRRRARPWRPLENGADAATLAGHADVGERTRREPRADRDCLGRTVQRNRLGRRGAAGSPLRTPPSGWARATGANGRGQRLRRVRPSLDRRRIRTTFERSASELHHRTAPLREWAIGTASALEEPVAGRTGDLLRRPWRLGALRLRAGRQPRGRGAPGARSKQLRTPPGGAQAWERGNAVDPVAGRPHPAVDGDRTLPPGNGTDPGGRDLPWWTTRTGPDSRKRAGSIDSLLGRRDRRRR